MNDLALITWTNTEIEDVFPVYFGNLKKYFSELKHSYVFINKLSEIIDDEHLQLINDENDTYGNRLLSCLEVVNEDYVLYMQEDFILYDFVNVDEIQRCIEFLKKTDCSSVKLICSKFNTFEEEIEKNIYKINHNSSSGFLSFTQQPAIWKKKDLITIIENLNLQVFRDFESGGTYLGSKMMQELGYYSCVYYDEEFKQRVGKWGFGHYDSTVFPYIATALQQGQWNCGEYLEELSKILPEYNIDIKMRGCWEGE